MQCSQAGAWEQVQLTLLHSAKVVRIFEVKIPSDHERKAGVLPHEDYMRLALAEAEAALDAGEVPVGAVIVHHGRVIGAAHNQRECLRDPTAHAEMIAITQAAEALGNWRLEDCALYVTLEPCPMCAGAVVQARLPLLVFGASDPKAGACRSLFSIVSDHRLNHQAEVVGGILESECASILKDFFAQKRPSGSRSL